MNNLNTKLLLSLFFPVHPLVSLMLFLKEGENFQFTFICDFQIYKIKCKSLKMVGEWMELWMKEEEASERNLKNMEHFVSQSGCYKN